MGWTCFCTSRSISCSSLSSTGRPAKPSRAGEQERTGIRAGQRDAQRPDICPGCRERGRHARQGKVDRPAHPHFFVGRRRRGRRQMHRHKEFAGGQREMGLAVFDIELAQRNSALAFCAGDVDFGAVNEQSGRQVAAEGGMTALSLRGDMASLPAILETISIGAPPPFALVVVNAARIEAQIAADGCHVAVTGPGDRFGRLAPARDIGRRSSCRAPARRGSRPRRWSRRLRSVSIAVSSSMPERSTSKSGLLMPRRMFTSRSVPPARKRLPGFLATGSDRFFDGARLGHPELGQRCGHDAAFRLASRAWRRRWISASMTRSGVTGSSSRSMPMALAMALTKAGGKPASAPSLASLAPNGP